MFLLSQLRLVVVFTDLNILEPPDSASSEPNCAGNETGLIACRLWLDSNASTWAWTFLCHQNVSIYGNHLFSKSE